MSVESWVALARRAARAPAAEWRDRGRQKLFEVRNRLACARGGSALPSGGALGSLGIGSDARLAEWWSARSARWFIDEARLATLRAARTDDASGVPAALERAREVCAGRFPFFSVGSFEIGEPGSWSRDPLLERSAPRRFHADVRYLDPDEVGDSRLVWEPSRFAAAIWLGVAHRVEGDARYWERFAALVETWFDDNPYPIGLHYCSALEVGLRAYAWVWALALFRERLADEPALLHRLLDGIWTACQHVEANLSRHFSPNTHLTGEAFALFACGAALPEFAEAERWRRLGGEILAHEARKQFHEDGTHRELSSGYHLYSCDFYLQAALIAHETGHAIGFDVTGAALRLCRRLSAFVAPDGMVPQWNDCDGGRLLSLGEAALDARPTLSAARAAFGEQAFGARGRAGAHEPPAGAVDPPTPEACGYALLMTPARPLVAPSDTHASSSRDTTARLPDSGIATHRSASGDLLVFRASPFGYGDCPHSHDAPLSVVLYLAGRPVLVDSGTGSYTRDAALRDAFRHASGKNVLTFDGQGPSVPDGPFGWSVTTDAVLREASFDERRGFRCAGSYETREPEEARRHATSREPLRVERQVRLREEPTSVEIVDTWRGNPGARVEAHFTLAPQIVVEPGAGCLRLAGLGDIAFSCEGPGGPQLRVVGTPYSHDYASIGETSALVFELGRASSGHCITRFELREPPVASGRVE